MTTAPTPDTTPFLHGTARLTLGSVDESDLDIVAQYNPKELQIDRAIQWTAPNQANNANTSKPAATAAKGIHLEYTGSEGRSLSIELLFDGYEDNDPSKVTGPIWNLEALATVRDADSKDEGLRRPHLCLISWGNQGLPVFRCVIESLSIKYTMFRGDGAPLRATATVKLKEADAIDAAKTGKP
jgi:hypothetical protein|nr:hypothetical protein [Kofleriaceae bacterium]